MKINLKDKFSSLIMNNKVIAVVSVILSFAIWMWIAIEKSPIETTVIKGVPVSFEMENSVPEQLGLEIFGDPATHAADLPVGIAPAHFLHGFFLLIPGAFRVTHRLRV